jgi:hypothetical protein
MKDIKISEKGVEKELNRLNLCKATGPDKVPVRILKETANIITPISVLRHSCNKGYVRNYWTNFSGNHCSTDDGNIMRSE